MSVARLALFGLFAGFLANPATAGPIWVTYQFDTLVTPKSDYPAGFVKRERQGSGRVDAQTPQVIATFRFNPLYPAAGAGGETRETESLEGITRFSINVKLTDEESGETGTLKVSGVASSTWSLLPDGTGVPVAAAFLFDDVSPTDLTLGGRNFDLELIGGSNTTGDGIQATVAVRWNSPSVQNVPEPATLILAGLGLVGVTARRRRVVKPSF